jgi:choline kinase
MSTEIVILAAGMGSRLGGSVPKPLTVLSDGRTIMQQQLDNLSTIFGPQKVNIVVGHKYEQIIEAHPSQKFIHNEEYDSTNTSKSLLKALKHVPQSANVLWLNGDVVFSPEILQNAQSLINSNRNFVTVNTSEVHDEEIKYTVDREGFIADLSKVVPLNRALGEAVGINYISAKDRMDFAYYLNQAGRQDYFEKGLELAIAKGMKVEPYDFSSKGLYAVEVDFAEDLKRANATIQS